jgi:hypothetical protein
MATHKKEIEEVKAMAASLPPLMAPVVKVERSVQLGYQISDELKKDQKIEDFKKYRVTQKHVASKQINFERDMLRIYRNNGMDAVRRFFDSMRRAASEAYKREESLT